MKYPPALLLLVIAPPVLAAPMIAPQPIYAPASVGAPPAGMDRVLAAHNRERARLGEMPLAWDDRLAQEAAQWARVLAQRGTLEHSAPSMRRGAGENLFMGTRGFYPPEAMVGDFIDERADFRPGIFPAVATRGDWHGVGHYTQIIWRSTRKVGCALARGRRDDVLVCRYWPAGNVFGQKVP